MAKKTKKDIITQQRENEVIQNMINAVRRDKPKEWSYEELVELDPRLSEDNDF